MTAVWNPTLTGVPVGEANALWLLLIGGKPWGGPYYLHGYPPPEMSVGVSEIGKTILLYDVPKGTNVSEAQICYRGQKPYSYGKLELGSRVGLYSWELKKGIDESQLHVGQLESYVVWRGPLGPFWGKSNNQVQLRTIGFWKGTGNRTFEFDSTKSPIVVNYGVTKVSKLGTKFELEVQGGNRAEYPPIGSNAWLEILENGWILEQSPCRY